MKFTSRLKHLWSAGGPWISFSVTIGVALLLYSGDAGHLRGAIVGFAESEAVNIGSTEPGRITSITAQVGQEIAVGQVIATLDTAPLDAEIAVAEADRSRLAAL